MAKYKLTNKAVEDLANIWNYTFEVWSERQADKYYEMLIWNFQEIANNPSLEPTSLLPYKGGLKFGYLLVKNRK